MTKLSLTIKFKAQTINIELDPLSTILELKEILIQHTGLETDLQKLIYKGKNLNNDNETLSFLKIPNGAKILLIGSKKIEKPKFVSPLDKIQKKQQIIYTQILNLNQPPHINIIKRGPLENTNYINNSEKLPKEIKVRNANGDESILSFNEKSLSIKSEKEICSILYLDISSYHILSIPQYEDKYVSIGLNLPNNTIWIYFIPQQYRNTIEQVIQKQHL